MQQLKAFAPVAFLGLTTLFCQPAAALPMSGGSSNETRQICATTDTIPDGWVVTGRHRSSSCDGYYNSTYNGYTITRLADQSDVDMCGWETPPEGWVVTRRSESSSGCQTAPYSGIYRSQTIEPLDSADEFMMCAGTPIPSGWVMTSRTTSYSPCDGFALGAISAYRIKNLTGQTALDVCIGQPVPSGWVMVGTHSGSQCPTFPSTLDDTVMKISNANAPVCKLYATPSVVPAGSAYSFSVTTQNVPSGATGYWYGTKNGSPDVTHAPAGPVPATFPFSNAPGYEGTYVRYMKIEDTAGRTVCSTNAVQVTLQARPTCSLQVSPSVVARGANYTFLASSTNLPAGTVAYWYGRKNGVDDVQGAYAGSGASFSSAYTNPADGSAQGQYTRWLEFRSGSTTLCTTNGVSVTLQ